MFELCGLKQIAIHPFAYTFNYNDESHPLQYRQELLMNEIRDDISWITSRYHEREEVYREHGFDESCFHRLIELLHRKLEYVRDHFAEDHSFEWIGGFNFIVAGVK